MLFLDKFDSFPFYSEIINIKNNFIHVKVAHITRTLQW